MVIRNSREFGIEAVRRLLRPETGSRLEDLVSLNTSREAPILELEHEGLHSILAYVMMAAGQELWKEELREAFLTDVVREGDWKALLREISDQLASAGFLAIAFKGAAAIHGLYPVMGLRPLSDIDLLVHECDLAAIVKLLGSLGFEALTEAPMVLVRGLWTVDLHLTPITKADCNFEFDLAKAWELSTPIFGDRGGVLQLSAEFELLVALIHVVKHSYSRLVWLVDIALLIDKLNPEVIAETITSSGAERCLLYSLWLIEKIFSISYPELVDSQLNFRRLNFFETRFLERCRLRDAPHPLGSIVLAFSAPTPIEGVRYLARTVYPPQGDFLTRCTHLRRLGLSVWRFFWKSFRADE